MTRPFGAPEAAWGAAPEDLREVDDDLDGAEPSLGEQASLFADEEDEE